MGFGQVLEGLLTGGQRNEYEDFVKRYNQGPPSQGYEVDEVARRYNQIAPALPPQDYQRAAMEAFERMSPQERAEFARTLQQRAQQQNVQVPGFPDVNRDGIDDRMQDPGTLARYTTQVQQQKPDILGDLLGPGGMLGSTAAKAALAGIAAMAASKILSKR